MLSSNTWVCAGSTIALTIRSFDPLERGDWTDHDSIDMALLWSADAGRNRVLLTSKISIALLIQSLDSLE